MKLKTQKKLKLLNSLLGPAEEIINNVTEDTQSDRNAISQLLTPQYLEMKRSTILNTANNNQEIERDFRSIRALYKNQKSTINLYLKRIYKEYVNAYHKITSLYRLDCDRDDKKTFLHVFETEKENQKIYKLKIKELLDHDACITLLPNCELFCFGNWNHPGLAMIISSDYKARMLPEGMPYENFSAIYFNRNVYCFGGIDYLCMPLNFSSKFNLDKNQWDKLAKMPIDDYSCHSIIYNEEILIAGRLSRSLLVYSIDINSFSTIPYEFAENTIKILINASRLYLIECKTDECGLIYESDPGDEYAWNIISKSPIGSTSQVYYSYNKGKVYILTENYAIEYYEFDLKQRKLSKICSSYY